MKHKIQIRNSKVGRKANLYSKNHILSLHTFCGIVGEILWIAIKSKHSMLTLILIKGAAENRRLFDRKFKIVRIG